MLSSSDFFTAILKDSYKQKGDWLVGIEHELFFFNKKTGAPIQFSGEESISVILEELFRSVAGTKVYDGANFVSFISDEFGLSLEAGCQVEYSSPPMRDLFALQQRTLDFYKIVRGILERIDIGVLAVGTPPTWTRSEINRAPKRRYEIMMPYMRRVGGLGEDQLLRTASIQVNLDYSDETDLLEKLEASLAIQPIITALFANSKLLNGRSTGFCSYRSFIWTDTDADRTGMLSFLRSSDQKISSLVEYFYSVPMYLIRRGGKYLDFSGQNIRNFANRSLVQPSQTEPCRQDFEDHLTTIFTEVRVKNTLEMRGADTGCISDALALAAIWVGLLYDRDTLRKLLGLTCDWSSNEIEALRHSVPKLGLDAPFRGTQIHDIAEKLVEMASVGLDNRRRELGLLRSEETFLDSARKKLANPVNLTDSVHFDLTQPLRGMLLLDEAFWVDYERNRDISTHKPCN
ncbi:MAG: glutamate-cysteine ligase family protein [Pseudomonadota bacterium]